MTRLPQCRDIQGHALHICLVQSRKLAGKSCFYYLQTDYRRFSLALRNLCIAYVHTRTPKVESASSGIRRMLMTRLPQCLDIQGHALHICHVHSRKLAGHFLFYDCTRWRSVTLINKCKDTCSYRIMILMILFMILFSSQWFHGVYLPVTK